MKVLKLFGGAIVGTVVFLIAIWAMLVVARFFSCGPNSADVKVMKPMAEKISEYIVKHGIPKSLKDIPDLPYGLEGCEYEESNYEKCYFDEKKYSANIFIPYPPLYEIRLFAEKSKTVIYYDFEVNADGKFTLKTENSHIYSSNTNGICTQLRQ